MNKKCRIIVAGGRDFADFALLADTLTNYIFETLSCNKGVEFEIISGRARGADRFGEKFADRMLIPVICFEPDWLTYGKGAGIVRNKAMAKYAAEEIGILFAFWDGKSRGTKNMIETAEKYGLEIHVIKY